MSQQQVEPRAARQWFWLEKAEKEPESDAVNEQQRPLMLNNQRHRQRQSKSDTLINEPDLHSIKLIELQQPSHSFRDWYSLVVVVVTLCSQQELDCNRGKSGNNNKWWPSLVATCCLLLAVGQLVFRKCSKQTQHTTNQQAAPEENKPNKKG